MRIRGVGLYQSDDAADLRDDVRGLVRAPWDGDRLALWALGGTTRRPTAIRT
jgi:hypothetical protein